MEHGIDLIPSKRLSNLVHFQDSNMIPIQRWFPYREGYSIELVDLFIKEFKINGTIFDPFVGSGTTILSARKNGLSSIGIDINPISILISKIKNEIYSVEDISFFEEELKKIKSLKKDSKLYLTQFELKDKTFNFDILQSLLFLKEYIQRFNNEKVKSVFFAAWLSIIESVSNFKKEGNGIKYKNRKRTPTGYIHIDQITWENDHFPPNRFEFVKETLFESLSNILFDIKYNYGFVKTKPLTILGNCLNFDSMFNNELELTFFSPPYCNCFDYFEIHKVELWLGQFVNNKKEMKCFKNEGFRSNLSAISNKNITYTNYHLENLISLLSTDKLWNKKIPYVIRGYFDDMFLLMSKLFNQTIKGGKVGIVVGNSAYSGVIIPTDILISNIAREIGFKVNKVYVTRHLTTSSQQKRDLVYLNDYLRESIIVLEK